jgi:hypothetical protein
MVFILNNEVNLLRGFKSKLSFNSVISLIKLLISSKARSTIYTDYIQEILKGRLLNLNLD